MPVGRLILTATARICEEIRDESLQAYYLPYWQAKPLMEQADDNLKSIAHRCEEPLPIASAFFPAITAARTAYARIEQQFAFLRVIEALRLYGAAHASRLPKTLDDVSEVPIPDDPAIGKPFFYELRGETAILRAAPFPEWQLNYEISFGKTTKK